MEEELRKIADKYEKSAQIFIGDMVYKNLYLREKIIYDNIHPTILGENILHILKREESKYIIKEKTYYLFELTEIIFKMIEDYQLRISLKLLDVCMTLSKHYKDPIFKNMDNVINSLYCEISDSNKEFDSDKFLYKLIERDISELIPNSIIIRNYKSINRTKPNFMVKINENMYPIIVNLQNVTNTTLVKVRKIMSLYNCDKGFLIGTKLTANYDDLNITYIDVLHLYKKYYPQE